MVAVSLKTITVSGGEKRFATSITVSICSAEPKKDPNAVRYTKLTYDECLSKHLKATDTTAMALAMDNDMTMVCFGLAEENSIIRVVRGEEIGTTVTN